MSRKWNKAKIIEMIRSLAKEKGGKPSHDDNKRLGWAAEKYFGSWNEAMKKAGFEPRPRRKWTKEEIDFLKNNYHKMTYGQISNILGHDKNSVNWKAIKLGLKKISDRKPPRYWSRDKVIKEIKALAEKYGQEYLYSTNVSNKRSDLHHAANRIFGSYRNAIKEAGFDYPKIVKLKIDYSKITRIEKRWEYWTKNKIIETLRVLATKNGESFLRPSNLRKKGGLFNAIWKTFGSFKTPIELAGYNYEKIIARQPSRYWTKKRVIEKIKELKEKYGVAYLAPSNIIKNEGSLYNAALKIFDSYSKAIETIGLDYEKIIGQKQPGYWTKERIISKFKKLESKHGLDYLSYSRLREKEESLVETAKHIFGSYKLALKEAGYDFEKIRLHKPFGYWSRERIINMLQEIAMKYGEDSLSYEIVKRKDQNLAAGARRIFGSYKLAVKEAGFDYFKIAKLKYDYWNKDLVIKRLGELAKEYGENYLCSSILQRKEADVFGAACKLFGSLESAVKEAGFDYEEIKRPPFGEPAIWVAWERCCVEMSKEIFNPNSVKAPGKIKGKRLYPDIQISNRDLIIDAKLNAWNESISVDIDNYIDYCDKLEFWCLEGNRNTASDRVEIVNVEELLKRLESSGADESTIKEFRKKIALIKRGIDPYEGVQKEILPYSS